MRGERRLRVRWPGLQRTQAHTHNKRRARAGVGVGRHRIMARWCLTMRLVFACQPANAYIKRSCCQRLMTRRALSCACTMSRQASTATRTCRGRREHERPCQSPIQTDRQTDRRTDRHRRRRRSLAHAMSCRRPPSATWPDMVSSTAQMLWKFGWCQAQTSGHMKCDGESTRNRANAWLHARNHSEPLE